MLADLEELGYERISEYTYILSNLIDHLVFTTTYNTLLIPLHQIRFIMKIKLAILQ
jgi:hypothetical protein